VENELFGRHGPNGVFGVCGISREVPEGLAVVQPHLFSLLGGMGVIWDSEVIRLGDAFVPLLPEFLPRLGVDEFLQLRLEFLFWGLFVTFGNFNRFPSVVVSRPFWLGIPRVYDFTHEIEMWIHFCIKMINKIR